MFNTLLTQINVYFKTILPSLKRFPYAYVAMPLALIFLFVGKNLNLEEQLKFYSFASFAGLLIPISISWRIAFEQLKGKELAWLKPWYEHLVVGFFIVVLTALGLLTWFEIGEQIFLVESLTISLFTAVFFVFAPFIKSGEQIPEFSIWVQIKAFVLGFFVAFLAGAIPLLVVMLIAYLLRIQLFSQTTADILFYIGSFVSVTFSGMYIINQFAEGVSYKKNPDKFHWFFQFVFGTLNPLIGFFSLLGSLGTLVSLSFILSNTTPSLVLTGTTLVLVIPAIANGLLTLFTTVPYVKKNTLARLYHQVIPFFIPVMTLLLLGEVLRAIFSVYVWEYSTAILFNLIFTVYAGYVSIITLRNKRILPVRPTIIALLIAIVAFGFLALLTNVTNWGQFIPLEF